MIKCVISDLGKVIITFDNSIFFRQMSENGPYTPEQMAWIVTKNSGLLRDFDTGKISPQEFYKEASHKLQVNTDFESFFSAYNDVFELNPDVAHTLMKLKTKYRLILLSNTDVMRFGFIKRKFPELFFFDDGEENIEAAAEMGIHTILFTPQTDLESALRQLDLSF